MKLKLTDSQYRKNILNTVNYEELENYSLHFEFYQIDEEDGEEFHSSDLMLPACFFLISNDICINASQIKKIIKKQIKGYSNITQVEINLRLNDECLEYLVIYSND